MQIFAYIFFQREKYLIKESYRQRHKKQYNEGPQFKLCL